MIRTPASGVGRRGSSPTSFTAWTPGSTWPDRLIELTGDADLWTRLQALRTSPAMVLPHRRHRLAAADHRHLPRPHGSARRSGVRKNLSEGLYIMLDENLGGGVSLQKNIAELPEALRPGILEARRAVERDVLLTPVLAALEERESAPACGRAQGV